MHPEFPDFKPLEIGDAKLIRSFERWMPSGVCEFSFANLMAWRDFDRPCYTFIDDTLCLRIDPVDETPFFLEPLGAEVSDRAMDVCLDHSGKLSRVAHKVAARARARGMKARPIEDHFDYIYRTSDLAELKGRKYDGKRNHIKRFTKSYPDYKYIALTGDMGWVALGLFDVWRDSQPDVISGKVSAADLVYSCQRLSLQRVFENFDELEIVGGALMADGECAGFAVGSRFKDDETCIHHCYSRPDMRGSFQTMLREVCRRSFAQFAYVNLEQDLGIRGLRKLKRDYYPVRIQEKFECELSGR